MRRFFNGKAGRARLGALAALVAFMLPARTDAQSARPTVRFYSAEDGGETVMSAGEAQTCQAPLELTCEANIEGAEGYSYTCEWRFERADEESPLLTRFEENTTYTLTRSGGYTIKLYVTFRDGDGGETEYESDAFSISISESQLSCPDGFSPNGDGINDVYNIKYQSIVKLQAVFFNRWGKKLYTMNLNNVDAGWDGRVGGKYVKDGVYFLNLNAVGSDGVEYRIKKAVNVLKGFSEADEGAGGE